MNRSIASLSIVPPGSLLCEELRSAAIDELIKDTYELEDVWQENGAKPQIEEIAQTNGAKPQTTAAQVNGAKPTEEVQESDEIESPGSQNGQVYGQAYVNRLLGKMFPNQPRLDGNGRSP